jgi:RNA polymerase sigma factor (sigma-70 family)
MMTCTPPVRERPVADLVASVRSGDQQAWDALIERYAPLVWSICRRYRLGDADIEDVAQSVWLHLVDSVGRIREPAALPGWLATTTQHECGRVLRTTKVTEPLRDTDGVTDGIALEQELLEAERHAALREAFAHLSPGCQELVTLLIQDPPLSYAEIATRLGISVGSIGPMRGRCVERLRRHPAVARLLD